MPQAIAPQAIAQLCRSHHLYFQLQFPQLMDQHFTTYWSDLTYNDVLYLIHHLPNLENPRSEQLNRLISALINHPALAPTAEDPDLEDLSTSSIEYMVVDSEDPAASIASRTTASATSRTTASASTAPVASTAATSQSEGNNARGDSRVSLIKDKGKSKAKTPKESKKKKQKNSKISGEFHFIFCDGLYNFI